MKILVACEESQAVTKALRELGHEAFSCDLQECSGGHPEWHIQGDVLEQLDKGWDAMIAHPTCTYLTNSGVRWLFKDGEKNVERWESLEEACKFFNALANAPIPLKALENPIPHKYAREGFESVVTGEWVEGIGKYDQLIQPYQFGHPESKATCFWLQGFEPLQETNNVKEVWKSLPKSEAQRLHMLPPSPERAKLRSKTFEGVAKAIAEQWGGEA